MPLHMLDRYSSPPITSEERRFIAEARTNKPIRIASALIRMIFYEATIENKFVCVREVVFFPAETP